MMLESTRTKRQFFKNLLFKFMIHTDLVDDGVMKRDIHVDTVINVFITQAKNFLIWFAWFLFLLQRKREFPTRSH